MFSYVYFWWPVQTLYIYIYYVCVFTNVIQKGPAETAAETEAEDLRNQTKTKTKHSNNITPKNLKTSLTADMWCDILLNGCRNFFHSGWADAIGFDAISEKDGPPTGSS